MDARSLSNLCASASRSAPPVEPQYLAIACDGPHAAKLKADLSSMLLMGCPRLFELLDTWQSRTDFLIAVVRMASGSLSAFASNGRYSLARQATRAVRMCKGKRCIWFFGLQPAELATVRAALGEVAARVWKPTLDDVPTEGHA